MHIPASLHWVNEDNDCHNLISWDCWKLNNAEDMLTDHFAEKIVAKDIIASI
jgi:hypothetical protein